MISARLQIASALAIAAVLWAPLVAGAPDEFSDIENLLSGNRGEGDQATQDEGAPGPLTEEQKEEARHHFVEGERRYEAGQFYEAADHFKRVYDITHSPEILFNIGRCYEEVQDNERAVENYEMYLRLSPDADDVDQVKARIADLKPEEELEPEAETRGLPPGLRLAVNIGADVPVFGNWDRTAVPIEAALHLPLLDWLHVVAGIGFGGFAGDEPKNNQLGFPTGQFSLVAGFLGSWPMNKRLSLLARVLFIPTFLFRERHETAIWLNGQGSIGLGIYIAGNWSATVYAVGGGGPVFIPKARTGDPWKAEGLDPGVAVGGRVGITYNF